MQNVISLCWILVNFEWNKHRRTCVHLKNLFAWIDMRNVSQSLDKEEKWELHLTEKLSLWDLNVGNAISMFASSQCQLVSPLTLNFSNCWRNNLILCWQLGSLWEMTSYWINSIFADSVILANIATVCTEMICRQTSYFSWRKRWSDRLAQFVKHQTSKPVMHGQLWVQLPLEATSCFT